MREFLSAEAKVRLEGIILKWVKDWSEDVLPIRPEYPSPAVIEDVCVNFWRYPKEEVQAAVRRLRCRKAIAYDKKRKLYLPGPGKLKMGDEYAWKNTMSKFVDRKGDKK